MCPWNIRFFKELPEDSAFNARDVLANTDVRQLARALLTMTQDEFSAASRTRR